MTRDCGVVEYMLNDKKQVEAWQSDDQHAHDVRTWGWRVSLVAVVAGTTLAGLAVFIPILRKLASYLVGFVVPLAVYRSLAEVSWRSHVLALGTTVISGIIAGLFHAGICYLLSSGTLSVLFSGITTRCSEGAVSATYFGAICFPMLPAGMIVLMMLVVGRSK